MPIANERQAKQRVISIIKQLKKNLSLSEPPQYTFPDEPVATHLGIKVQEGLLPSGHDGLYHPDPPRIIINRSGSQERDNFTYFHEITHHLVRQDNELYSFLHEYCPTEADFTRTLDTYCNIGAAEFIIPSSDVQDMIRANGFGIELLSQLDEQYPASKPAIAFQLAGCALHKCVIVVCDYGQVPKREHQQHQLIASDSKDQPALFVRYSASSPSFPYSVGRFVIIPQNHIISEAYYQEQLLYGPANIPFRSGTVWTVVCEAMFYKGHVYALFNVTSPDLSHQLTLDL